MTTTLCGPSLTALAVPAENALCSPKPSLEELAAQINAAHVQCEAAVNAGLQHALDAGRLLQQVKANLPHGELQHWVKANCRFSGRTARGYLRIAKRWPELSAKRQRAAVLSYREAVRLLGAPKADPEGKAPAELDATASLENEPADSAFPEGFTPEPGRCLSGGHSSYPIWIAVAESLEHPGYWHVQIVDFRGTSAIDCGTVRGTRRAVNAEHLAGFFQWLLRHESLHSDEFNWAVITGDLVRGVQEHCEHEAHLHGYAHSYWWRNKGR